MNYTLNQLRIFLKVAELKSITKAADALFLTQPAVSIQLRNFQNQFEIPLLETINKKIYVTDFGYDVMRSTNRIIEELNNIDNLAHAHLGNLTGKLRISVVSTGKYIAPYFIADFIKKHPNVDLVLDVTNKSQVIKSLIQNEIDFALVSIIPENINVEKIDLMDNNLFPVISKKYNFVFSKKNQYDIFKHVPLIYRENGSGTRFSMERYLLRNKINVTKKLELTSNEAVKQAVIAGLGFSIMPLIGVKNEIEKNELQLLPMKGFPITSKWSLIWLNQKAHTSVANSYLNFLREKKEEIITDKFGWITNENP